MRKIIFSVLILCFSFVFMGASMNTSEASAAKETTLRIATFNIDAKNIPDVDALRKLLIDNKVEIVGLQEVDKNTKRNPIDTPLKFEKGVYKDACFAKAIDFQGGEYGTCIVSQYKLIEKDVQQLDSTGAEEQRGYARVVIEKDGKKIAVYNTHLSWESEKIRNKQLNDLKAILNKDTIQYKIIVGDFNVDQHHKELNMFVADYNLSNGKDGAWYDTYNGVDPTMKVMSIDNIITSKNIEIKQVKMVETKLSDHNLFFADLKFLEE